jgi:hypothetical protein
MLQMPEYKNTFFALLVAFGFLGLGADASGYRAETIPVSVRDAFKTGETAPHLLAETDQFIWGTSVTRWSDGKYHAYASRWSRAKGFSAWLTDSTIVHAVADRPEGPYRITSTVLKSRNRTGWDLVNAHNPYICRDGDQLHLYYIASRFRGEIEKAAGKPFPSEAWLKKNRSPLVRNSQCIGVASSRQPAGPFERSPEPVVVPHGNFKNIAVNPAVIQEKGRFLMVMKGDASGKEHLHRIQLVGESKSAAGPFRFSDTPVYAERQTEDACIWFNQKEGDYNMVCHVMGQPDLAWFKSKDGQDWQPAPQPVFMKKEIRLDDGTIWKPKRFERPFVLTDDQGEPIMLFIAILDQGRSGNIAIPLRPAH